MELGVGFRTRLPSSAPYVLAAALLLGFAGLTDVLVVAFGFAVGRSIAPVHRMIRRTGQQWDAAMAAAGRTLAVSSSLVALAALAALSVQALV